ncbi:MAG: PD40 domain-containing protein [Planctomycetes bacterium]|nr:PD40 domain-containing protein [Planctomycetota bacterium]
MKKVNIWIAPLLALLCDALTAQIPMLETGGQTPMPAQWIDKDTGHKLKRISNRKGSNRSFYFHNDPFVKGNDGKNDLMIFYGSTDTGSQIFSVNLETLKIEQLTDQPGRKSGEIIGSKRREVFYQIGDSIFATHIDAHTTRLVYVFPKDFTARITTLNADETKLAGTWAGPQKRAIHEKFPAKGDYFTRIFEAKIPHTLFTLDVESGELNKIHNDNTWLGHIQFSTTDPDMLMFCHEGPWHLLDRIWNINTKTKAIRKIHERTIHREIAGHEFWSPDGKTIWYDLQVPRGDTFYLAACDVRNGKKTRYQMSRDEWSIHFNISPDQKRFCGDGGDPTQVARAKNGMWIYLFTPNQGRLQSEKLVNMKHHQYRRLEPNVHFSPDGKWVIFRANFEGDNQIYAVEINKKPQQTP